jgi:D-3-phosphoglycerate dehydrogenase
MIKVLIGPSSFAALDKGPLELLLSQGFEVIDNPFKRKLTKKELAELLPGVSGLIAGLETLDREVMERSDLKVISRCGSGLSNVDLAAAKELGVQVYYTPQGPTLAVAELTVGVLLSLLRQIPQMNKAMHERRWQKIIGSQLFGKTVAIIGFGMIGRHVCGLLKAFGVRVVATDPNLTDLIDDTPIVSLRDALSSADVVILHCSGECVVLSEKEFEMMKDGVVLLNAARGGLIDESALLKALDRGKVSGAWLDTFACEPYDGPLCDYPNVVLTPHVGSYTAECRRQMELEAAENLIRGLREASAGGP